MADEVKKAKLDLVTEEEVDEEEREFVVLAQHAEVIRAIAEMRLPVIAVDLPSGANASSPECDRPSNGAPR